MSTGLDLEEMGGQTKEENENVRGCSFSWLLFKDGGVKQWLFCGSDAQRRPVCSV